MELSPVLESVWLENGPVNRSGPVYMQMRQSGKAGHLSAGAL
jgi:hypothetical protein